MVANQKGNALLPQPTNNTPLITLVWLKENPQEQDARQIVQDMIRFSCGPYGSTAITGGDTQLAWGMLLPDRFTPLTCWSIYSNGRELCLFEGEMYDDLPGLRLLPGENAELAKMVAAYMRRHPNKRIKDLNGIYSAVYVKPDHSCAYVFGDSTGTRSVFWVSDEQHFVVTNNLWAFRGFTGFKRQWDKMALTQILTLGFPLAGRTFIDGVRQLQRGKQICSCADGRTFIEMQIEPIERQSWSFRKSVAFLRENMDETMGRICHRLDSPIGIGLSGGLDSRICLASLHTKGLEHHNFTFCLNPDEADNKIAKSATELLGEQHTTVTLDSPTALSLYRDLRIINEGESQGFGFFLLAAYVQRYSHALIIGSEAIRDTPLGPFWIWSVKNKHDLADCMLKAQMGKFSPNQVCKILDPSYQVSWQDVLDEWHESFEQIHQPSIFDVYLDQQIEYRVQRRTRPRLESLRWFCQPIYPYMDGQLYTAFRSIPLNHLKGERAHLALLCDYKTGLESLPNAARGFAGVPIGKEYQYRHIVHLGRLFRARFMLPFEQRKQELKGALGFGKSALVPLLEEEISNLKNCELFHWKGLQIVIEKARHGAFTNRDALHSVINVIVINDFLFGSGLSGERSLKYLESEREIHFVPWTHNAICCK